MKFYIYLSGLVSAFLFLGWLFAILMNIPRHHAFLIPGILVFTVVYIPLVRRKQKMHKEKMKEIIENYKNKTLEDPNPAKPETGFKGWNMNNSPFRSRKSGLTWGGGNIKGVGATRGDRKKFLNK